MTATIEEPIQPIGPGSGGGRFGRAARSLGARATGFSAVGVKELRGRMRGKRAFVLLTIYLVILGGFAWMVELLLERSFTGGFNSVTYASAQIGRYVFVALLLLETLLVMLLAPAYTAGAISLEREKQTLDLLITTPISSLAIVLGKLLSALTYVFLLIVSSIPLTALVFVFGGVAPEDVVKGYLMLMVTAIGLGCIGLFCSALFRRTQAATVVTYFIVLAITLGASFTWVFWGSMAGGSFGRPQFDNNGNAIPGRRGLPPEALLWFNPFVSAVDVICGTETGFGGTCSIVEIVTGAPDQNPAFGDAIAVPVPAQNGVIVGQAGGAFAGQNGGAFVAQPAVAQAGPTRDTYWPRAAAAWLILSVVLVLLSVNLVSPTRRWHRPHLRGRRGKPTGDAPAAEAALEPAPVTGPPGGSAGDGP
jgi:ABC-type transport system involved in multi-copper enzyme maturation permease subunit